MMDLTGAVVCLVTAVVCMFYTSWLVMFNIKAVRYIESAITQLEDNDDLKVEYNTLVHVQGVYAHATKEIAQLAVRVFGFIVLGNAWYAALVYLNSATEFQTYVTVLFTMFATGFTYYLRTRSEIVETDCITTSTTLMSLDDDQTEDPKPVVEH